MKAAKDNQVGLLSENDPAPVEWVNADSDARVLLLCEHAGNTLPQSQPTLGLQPDQLTSHIAWDIGAAALARELADLLQAPLLLQRYSRLLIDCNRPPGTTESIPEYSDGLAIPGNQQLDRHNRYARQLEIFDPLDQAINEGLQRSQRVAVFSIHSFTPRMQNQQARPWHAGFLTRSDTDTAETLISHLQQQQPDLTLALNEPYCIDDDTDWFIPQYAEHHQLMHSLIEVRNDQLRSRSGITTWATMLASAINTVQEQP